MSGYPSVLERLQPSLLDRLAQGHEQQQGRSTRQVIGVDRSQLRQYVLRDLGHLLNTVHLQQQQELQDYPHCRASVINYGIPCLSGAVITQQSLKAIEQALVQAIGRFEPRIDAQSLTVTVTLNQEQMSKSALFIEIDGLLWGQPVTELSLRTQVDLETGTVTMTEP